MIVIYTKAFNLYAKLVKVFAKQINAVEIKFHPPLKQYSPPYNILVRIHINKVKTLMKIEI